MMPVSRRCWKRVFVLFSLFSSCTFFCFGQARPSAASAPSNPLAPYQAPAAPDAKAWPRERLVGFMNELIDFVYKNHVVTDPARPVFGMTYEFSKGGNQIQAFGLDTMHDGGWFMGALAVAQRAVPEGHYLEKIQQYQVPFYTNTLNHSDRLFPAMKAGTDDRRPLTAPVKGWLPRGWDDGKGINKVTGKPFGVAGYDIPSNHLEQDVADALLNVWLTTRDPAVAEAIGNVQQYSQDYYGDIFIVADAAGIVQDRPELWRLFKFEALQSRLPCPAITGLFEGKGAAITKYNDDLAWAYRAATARYLKTGEFPEAFTLKTADYLMGMMTCMEFFNDARPWQYGFYGFDIQRLVQVLPGQGKLSLYASMPEAKAYLHGARGIQFAWLGAAALPALARNPGLWERDWRQNHPTDALVRIVDAAPAIDGRRDPAYEQSQAIEQGRERLSLLSDPKSLYLCLESDRPDVDLTITPELTNPAGAEPLPGCRLRATRDGKIDIQSGEGKPLVYASGFTQGSRWTAEFRIPYAAVPGQAVWLNGVDFGRYRVTLNSGSPQASAPRMIYLLSSSERLRRRLEAHTLGTIQNWHEIWQQHGCIPSGWRGPGLSASGWDMSDAGNVAHLVQTIALWLIYQQGTSEWELIKQKFPAEPIPARPLPASVLKAQRLQSAK